MFWKRIGDREMKALTILMTKLLTPTADQLINQGNREMHKFHLGKYRNFTGALAHRKRAEALFQQARKLRGN